MFRSIVFFFLVTCTTSFALAQPGGEPVPSPVVAPDDGTVASTPLEVNPGNANINCWVSRNSERAIALHVYNENGLKAKFRQYQFNGETFASKGSTITNNGTALLTPGTNATTHVVAVSLVKPDPLDPRHPDIYKMVYTKDGTDYVIGYLNFVRGKLGRSASKVSIKLRKPRSGEPVATEGIKVEPNSGDPCDEMPIDDIGEENTVERSGAVAFAPSFSIPPVRPDLN